ncbi:hypothetical protein GVX82_00835 [Patescibacteria group bacterium]|jgi:hypothetical protein|nr:hypothetical protein [Patescibacteria group bacterium]
MEKPPNNHKPSGEGQRSSESKRRTGPGKAAAFGAAALGAVGAQNLDTDEANAATHDPREMHTSGLLTEDADERVDVEAIREALDRGETVSLEGSLVGEVEDGVKVARVSEGGIPFDLNETPAETAETLQRPEIDTTRRLFDAYLDRLSERTDYDWTSLEYTLVNVPPREREPSPSLGWPTVQLELIVTAKNGEQFGFRLIRNYQDPPEIDPDHLYDAMREELKQIEWGDPSQFVERK